MSHTDCEDLADRIRALRMDLGELGGPTLPGPGWSNEARTYATGDRVLLHANLGAGATRLHNGTTGTVSHVDDTGVLVRFDDGRLAPLAREFVEGRRANRDPNLSHAWARTVDGAQGGTWAQVHLLGTSALDRFRGYVGQSRGQFPTHTWNTKRVVDHDHGALVDQRRSAAEEVLAAMGREPLKTFAAGDDPWVLHRRLDAERAIHHAELEAAPPPVHGQLATARAEATRFAERRARLATELHRAGAELDAISPLSQLRRAGREARAAAAARVATLREKAARAEEGLARTGARLDRLEAADQLWRAFEAKHGWRRERIDEINDELARHWARTTLTAVREDDPLAFGIDELRRARATYAGDLDAVLRTVPADRSGALRDAEARARRAEETRRFADTQAARRAQALDDANQRHWGRRNKSAVSEAEWKLTRATTDLVNARERATQTRERLAAEQESAARRHEALESTEDVRTELGRALHEIDVALDDTRVERVVAITHDDTPPFYLVEALGDVPESRGGQRAWCGLAAEIERYRDRHGVTNEFLTLGPEPQRGLHQVSDNEWNRIDEMIDGAGHIIGAAHELDSVNRRRFDAADSATWAAQLREAQRRLEATVAVEVPEMGIEAEPDLGLSW